MNTQKTNRSNTLPALTSSSSATYVESSGEDIGAGKRRLESDDEFTPQAKAPQANAKKRKQKADDKLPVEATNPSVIAPSAPSNSPPLKANKAGKDLIVGTILENKSYLSNVDLAGLHFEQKGKVHRLVDLNGKAVSVLMMGALSTTNLGKYGNFNMEYERSLEKTRLSFHLQAMPGWEAQHQELIQKMQALEQKQFGVGKVFTAEDKQLAVKPGDRILLERKIWRTADGAHQAPVCDDPGLNLWADMLASKKVPNYFQLGAYDYNGILSLHLIIF